MISARVGSRIAAVPRTARSSLRCHRRYQSTSTSSSGSGSASHFATGVAGGIVGTAVAYGIYSFTPAGQTASKINKAAAEANSQYKEIVKKLQNTSPNADQAVNSIKQYAYTYAAWVPGGKGYVDAAFKDWETVREAHKDEADKIVNDAYKQIQQLSKGGLSLETASKAYDVIAEFSKRVAELSGDAVSDILDNHPGLKEKFGPAADKLQELGKQYGPEAKKQVDDTWNQVKDIFATGFSAQNVDKARKLVEEKVQQVQKLGDEAWNKSLEAAKPYLDKNSKVKELIEKNADALKQGNVKELFDKARAAVDSGDAGDLEKYVKSAVEKGKSKASDFGLDKYVQMIPRGDEVLGKLKQIRDVVGDNSEEGQKLMKETVEELEQVLEKQAKKGKDLAQKAQKEAK